MLGMICRNCKDSEYFFLWAYEIFEMEVNIYRENQPWRQKC